MDQGGLINTDIWVATTTLFNSITRLIRLRLDSVLETLREYTQQVFAVVWEGLNLQPEAALQHLTAADKQSTADSNLLALNIPTSK